MLLLCGREPREEAGHEEGSSPGQFLLPRCRWTPSPRLLHSRRSSSPCIALNALPRALNDPRSSSLPARATRPSPLQFTI